MTDMSQNKTEQCKDGAYQYEVEGQTVEISEGDTWTLETRSGSGWYTKRYEVHSIGQDGISYTMSFEGNYFDRYQDDPTLFGTQPVENGDARYVQTDTEYSEGDDV